MRRGAVILVMCVALVGCGGGGAKPASTGPTSSTATTSSTPASGQAALESAVRAALHENATLSDYVLSHNAVPVTAKRSTGGPALAALRSAAAHRKAGKVRVQLLSSTVEVRSVQLDPSFASATASVVERSRVRVYQHGRRVGGVRALNEPASVELHRDGDKSAFVVWKLSPTP